MNKVVVFERPDGGVSIVRPVPWARKVSRIDTEIFSPPKRLEEISTICNIDAYLMLLANIIDGITQVEWAETEDQFCQRIVDKETERNNIPVDATVFIIDANTIPSDRSTRNSFKLNKSTKRIDNAPSI